MNSTTSLCFHRWRPFGIEPLYGETIGGVRGLELHGHHLAPHPPSPQQRHDVALSGVRRRVELRVGVRAVPWYVHPVLAFRFPELGGKHPCLHAIWRYPYWDIGEGDPRCRPLEPEVPEQLYGLWLRVDDDGGMGLVLYTE